MKSIMDAPSGMIGLETALAVCITNLVKPGHLSLMQLLEKMTINPASFYNLEVGQLTEGHKADIVIFDESQSWVVDKKEFVSKAVIDKGEPKENNLIRKWLKFKEIAEDMIPLY